MISVGIFSALVNYLDEKVRTNQEARFYIEDYLSVGRDIYYILHKNSSRLSYLLPFEFDELVSKSNESSRSQYVYYLKLGREMTKQECLLLERLFLKELSLVWKTPYSDLVKKRRVSIIGTSIFLSKKLQ